MVCAIGRLKMVEVYVGTSGWLYDWNEGGDLEWYASRSGLNAIELNASFYRFPFPTQVKSWAKKGEGLRWSVKVHRSITHLRKLGSKALETWDRFRDRFKPMEHLVDFYLFQLPPSFSATDGNRNRLREFAASAGLGWRMAVEFRHESWFSAESVELCREIGATLVSIDAPVARWIVSSNKVVYLRVHGRDAWYAYDYSDDELRELAEKTAELAPEKVYVFFNNNHWMLGNARVMRALLCEILR